MIKYAVHFVILFTYISSVNAVCVMQGVCGRNRDHVCRPANISYQKMTRQISNFCHKYPINSNGCCTEDQIYEVENSLLQAKRWFRGKCYDLLKELFCDMHCSTEQDTLISDLRADGSNTVTSFTYAVKEADVNNLFDACKDITFLFYRLINKVCLKQPCTAKEFLRSIGTMKSHGGKSPFQINFKYV